LLTCKDFYAELNNLLDDSCCEDLKPMLEQHMRDCPNCYVVFDTTRKTISVYKSRCGEPQPVPEAIEGRLFEALAKKMREKRMC
jgi:hypothetical protein